MRMPDLRGGPFAMPPTRPAFPHGPYRFIDREPSYSRTRPDMAARRAVEPEPGISSSLPPSFKEH
jgi:acetoacetate decarboxylase